MLKFIPLPCAIVDIETTGGNVTYDRITEIGIIEVTAEGVREWSSLINPRTPIPAGISALTGITNEMVADAPYFEQVAKEILLRLQGKLFVAHNVRFDYGFIRNEFARLAYSFKAKLMCTVKLSRYLYADQPGHSLEKIIARHQIFVTDRHRALADAKATYTFMKIAEEEKGETQVQAALKHQYRKESLPAGFDPHLIDHLPATPGVYYFWGENNELLYVGKSISIRKRVLSHFTADHTSSREMKMCQQTRHISFDSTAGELSALILESQQVKALQPLYNRRLRRVKRFYSIYLTEGEDGILTPQIASTAETPPEVTKHYGLFSSQKKAQEALQAICHQRGLCYQVCGLEPRRARACTGHQLKKCAGYCTGKQSPLAHNVHLLEGLSSIALKTWPYSGPVALVERHPISDDEHHILVDNWCILGIAYGEEDYAKLLNERVEPQLDRDSYRYLVAAIFTRKKGLTVIPLGTSQTQADKVRNSHRTP